ncbi:hypothetical protein FRX31_007795, partial [Thalictrum thalictroides]
MALSSPPLTNNILQKPFLSSKIPSTSQSSTVSVSRSSTLRCSVTAVAPSSVKTAKEYKLKSLKARQIVDSR